MTDVLGTALALPCGAKLPNRLAKAAMTEGVADAWLRATSRHERLYRRWSEGGAGLLLTGIVAYVIAATPTLMTPAAFLPPSR